MRRLIFAALALFAVLVHADPYDLLLTQRNSTDTGNIQRIPPYPVTCGPLFFETSTLLPKWYTLGPGLTCVSGVLDTVAATPTWAALTGKPTWTSTFDGSFVSISSKPSTLLGYGITDAYPLAGNPSGFLTGITSGQVASALGFTPYNATNPAGFISGITGPQIVAALGYTPGSGSGTVTSVSAGAGLSGGTFTTSGTISMPSVGTAGSYTNVTTDAQGRVTAGTNRSVSFVTKSIGACFQVSATRDADVLYNVEITASAAVIGGAAGTLFLETFTDSACTTGTQEIMRQTISNTNALIVALGNVTKGTLTVQGPIGAGLYAKLRTVNDTGTPTYTARPGWERLN